MMFSRRAFAAAVLAAALSASPLGGIDGDAVGSGVAAASPAAAQPTQPTPEAAACTPTGPRTSTTVQTHRWVVGGAGTPLLKQPIVVLRGLQMCAGQPHRFVGSHVSTVSRNMLRGTDILCVPADGDLGTPAQQAARRSVMSTRNHGSDVSRSATLAVRWLFTPDRDGRYDCTLRAWGRTPGTTTGTVQVLDDVNTRLSVSAVEPGGREWRQDDDVYLCHDVPDDAGCARSGRVLSTTFQAAPGARSIDVYAGVEASICARGYAECTDGTAGMGDFTIRTRLIATQLRTGTTSSLCPGAQAHTRDLTTPVPGGGELNHTKIHIDMGHAVPVVTNPDCSRSFAIRVLVDYVRTNPDRPNHGGLVEGRIPDGNAGDPEALGRAYTSAMALNNL
ncbi:MAG TPA: hypothetical protein VIL48_04465 [Acidimicrobiales bacterium]